MQIAKAPVRLCIHASDESLHYLLTESLDTVLYEGESISNQPIPFPMDRDGHDFHALFQYMFYTWLQNCTCNVSFFNKILNVKHG